MFEVYDPSKEFEFVRTFQLYKNKHKTPFNKLDNTESLFDKSYWTTNGSYLVLIYKSKARFFNMETGI